MAPSATASGSGRKAPARGARTTLRILATLTVLATLAGSATLAGCGAQAAQPPARRSTDAANRAPRPGDSRAATLEALPSLAAQDAAVRRLARIGRPIFCGGRRVKLVALTFDDGPGPYTGIALRELRRAGARATFFLVARSVKRFPGWPRRERALAAIGDHTATHPYLPALSLAAAIAEIKDGRAAAERAAGGPVDLFRPPYGGHTAAIDRAVRRAGMAQILWDVDSVDSRVTPPADFHEISAWVRRHARPGSIVLMHENRGQTIRALRAILPVLQKKGLRTVTVPELLAADPPSRAQLRAGRRGCGVPTRTSAGS